MAQKGGEGRVGKREKRMERCVEKRKTQSREGKAHAKKGLSLWPVLWGEKGGKGEGDVFLNQNRAAMSVRK